MKLAAPALFRLGLLVLILTLAADQLHKWYMIQHTGVVQEPITVTSFFNLVMVWNNGISFGMFRDNPHSQIIFSCVSLTIVLILLVWLSKITNKYEALAIGIVCGGALGNVVDRLNHGAVADFFDFHLHGQHWPAFNIADSAVFIGAVILCCTSLFTGKEKEDDHATTA